MSVIAATGIALSCGTNYAYSAWAPQFASRLHLTATQQNLIGNFGNIGMYAMGIPGGYLIDRRGPRWGVFAGVLALACGYFPLRAAYLAGPGGYGMPWLCLMGLMTGMGSCTAFSAAIKLVKASSPYEAVPTDERPDLGRRDSNRLRRASDHERHGGRSSGEIDETSSLVDSDSTSTPGDLLERKSHHPHHPKPEVTGLALLHTPKFWQLFIMLGLLCGVGLMTINNIGNNARSLWHHYDDTASDDFIQSRQLLHVSILSLASFVGRLCSGIGSDWLIHHHASRFWTLVASALAFCGAQVVALTLENPNHLFYLSGLTGLAYGALFGVYPALVADAFGPSGLGINWGAMTMAPVLSGNIFNLAYGRILDAHSHFQGDGKGGGEVRCEEGKACYGSAYWVTVGASVVGVGWSLWCIRLEKVGRMREAREVGGGEHEG
ncbi:hypothetical protein LTS02_013218 [Friedmanniomyces endolithicus]|nr:hypothetical protein LTS02_013218 [Friedmanniomyces endolithicus]